VPVPLSTEPLAATGRESAQAVARRARHAARARAVVRFDVMCDLFLEMDAKSRHIGRPAPSREGCKLAYIGAYT
jgi:hypothetical protein